MNLKLSGVCELLRNTEGRDKCCKFIQYQSRMFMYLFTEPSPLVSDRFRKLFRDTKVARKWLRLFKWVNEYQHFMDLMDKPPEASDDLELFIRAGVHICLFGYYFMDNLYLLTIVQLIKRSKRSIRRNSVKFWWFALLLNLIKCFRKIRYAQTKIKAVEKKKTVMSAKRYKELKERYLNIKGKNQWNFVKTMGDIVVATAMSGFAEMLGFYINDGIIGAAGTVSSVISVWNLYRTVNFLDITSKDEYYPRISK